MKEYKTENITDWITKLCAGDEILLSGRIYTARDAAHKRIHAAIQGGAQLPFPLKNAVVYYAGPTPESGDFPAGSIGPTTSSRMDPYLNEFMQNGLIATIGKGNRSEAANAAVKRWKGVYFSAIGGAGALYARSVKSIKVIAFEDLGCESVKQLDVEKMPLFVAVDSNGNTIFKR